MAAAQCPLSNMEDFLLSGSRAQLKFLLLSDNGSKSKSGKFQPSWSDNLFEFLGKVLEISYVALLQDKESSSSEDESDELYRVVNKRTTRESKQHELDKKAIAGLLQIVKLRERQKLLFSLDPTNNDGLKSFSDSIREITQGIYKASDSKSDGQIKKGLKHKEEEEEILKFVVKQEKEEDNEEKPQFKKSERNIDGYKEKARSANIKVEKQLETKTVKNLPVKVEIKRKEVTHERPSAFFSSSEDEYTPPRIPGTKPVTVLDLATLSTNIGQVKKENSSIYNTNVYAPRNIHAPTNYYFPTNVYSPTISLNQSISNQFIPQITCRRSPSPDRFQLTSPQPTPFFTPEPSPKTRSVLEKPGYTYVREHTRQGHYVQGHWRGDTWVNGYYRQGHTVKGHYRKK